MKSTKQTGGRAALWKGGIAALSVMMIALAGCDDPNKDSNDTPPPQTFVAVTGISGVSVQMEVGTPLTLSGTVEPSNVTNKTIVWSKKNEGTTATASVSDAGVVNATAAGDLIVTATIANGATETTPYTQDFTITVYAEGSLPTVSSVTITVQGSATAVAKGGTLQFSAVVAGENSPSQSVTWSIVQTNTKAETTINTEGVLTVANDEALTTLTVKATSTVDNTVSNTAAVRVSDTIVPAQAGDRKTETLHGVAVPFRYVPAGSFQRDGESEENISVISKGYWLAETETTQELFQAVMGNNPSAFSSNPAEGETQNQRPVERVTWYAAIAFCNKLSLANGKQAVYSVKVYGTELPWAALLYTDIPTENNDAWNAVTMDASKNGYRLPTEMEWMWAAMGADKTSQPNTLGYTKNYAGSMETGTAHLGEYMWYGENSGGKTHQVGMKRANELGLKDMSGNVYEWCWDWFGGTAELTGTVGVTGALTDYTGAATGTQRMQRGGSYTITSYNIAWFSMVVRSMSDQMIYAPSSYMIYPGFRVACRAE